VAWRIRSLAILVLAIASPLAAQGAAPQANPIDQVLRAENQQKKVKREPLPLVDDLTFLRRIYVDMIGRIPTEAEIQSFVKLPAATRRVQIVDSLMQSPRFADRWTIFYADMLRLRSGAEGGTALTAFIRQSVVENTPYDELVRRLISTNGRAGSVPEVGYVLGDNADPMALAGVTSQVFMGVRIACAQCHNHPFDVWKREDFYGFAAYFGKTRRYERRFKDRILGTFASDVEQTTILWPPEGVGEAAKRKPMTPRFPIALDKGDRPARPIARLNALRQAQQVAQARQLAAAKSQKAGDIDDLLDEAAGKVNTRSDGVEDKIGVAAQAKKDVKAVGESMGGTQTSPLREQLATYVTDPRNRYFARSFVNRIWFELIGKGIVEPLDDFSDQHPPSHAQLLDHLADEFIASGYNVRQLIRSIATSEVYQRPHIFGVDEATRVEMESAFLATPMRRMLSEVLYDSVITAGHLSAPKHVEGKNLKTVWRRSTYLREKNGRMEEVKPTELARGGGAGMNMAAKPTEKAGGKGYDLENAIELDFDAVLKEEQGKGVMLDKMEVKSKEEIEAERMAEEATKRRAASVDRFVKAIIDDNPSFSSSMRMATPAPEGHFLRVFGQPSRQDLGEERDHDPTMRQALMMLNGRMANEACRVGELEPVYALLVGPSKDLEKAIRLAYREVLTREPTDVELADARQLISEAKDPLEGMADLRWVLLNGNEFRFLP